MNSMQITESSIIQTNSLPHDNEEITSRKTHTAEKKDSRKTLFHDNILAELPESFSSLLNNITNTSIRFTNSSADDVSYVSIIDKKTNEVLRTFPTEEMRKVLNNINIHLGSYMDTSI